MELTSTSASSSRWRTARLSRALAVLLPLAIVFVALGLRLYGIDWDQGHLFHPDERAILMRVGELRFPPLNDLGVLKGIVDGAGLDWRDLGPRIESGEYRDSVMREYAAAKEKGVGGTPTYMIGGELHGGDVSIDDLREAIRSASAG